MSEDDTTEDAHPELKKALRINDYGTICSFFHTMSYPSDSEQTIQIKRASFIQGWKECKKLYQGKRGDDE